MGICFNIGKGTKQKIIRRNSKESTDATVEDLKGIIDMLLDRKKFLENKYGKKLNTQNNNNEEPKSLKDYQLIIDKLGKEVLELEKINNILIIQNKNILIKFCFEGQEYIINVDSESKLGDAFQSAIFNEKNKGERYTTSTMNSETNFNDDYFKNNEIFNYKQMMFLLGGEDITKYFTNNESVSSLVKGSDSYISIIVWIPLYTKVKLKESYNKFYNNE
jgi:hypothetical protein